MEEEEEEQDRGRRMKDEGRRSGGISPVAGSRNCRYWYDRSMYSVYVVHCYSTLQMWCTL